jgi:disulfide bond formation protein DsbB
VSLLFHPDGKPDWPRLVPFSLIFICVSALGIAYTAQYGFEIKPCILCLYQRIPYALTSVIALAGIMMPRGQGRNILTGICIPVLLVGAGIAIYHVGVEQHWWVSAAGCGGSLATETTIADFQAALQKVPEKPCDAIDWTLFGLSMAVYNAALYTALGIATFLGLRKMIAKTR